MLTSELMSRLKRVEIKTSRLANEQLAGQYRSVFKGHGINFDEVRPYQEGDDIRVIDWNVSARTGDLFVKVFVEERELTVFLLLDMSGSSRFGTRGRTRLELITEVAAVLAFSAIRNNDRVGLLIFTDSVEHFVPPKKGKIHVLRVIRDILTFTPKNRGSAAIGIEEAVKYLTKVTKKTSVAFLISDFFVDENRQSEVKRALSIGRQRHDIIPIMALDPMDERLPSVGIVPFEDAESGGVIWVDTSSASVRRSFEKESFAQRARMESLFKALSLDYIKIWTNENDYIKHFNQLFQRRSRRF